MPDGRYVLRSVAALRNLLDEGGNDSEASNGAQISFAVTMGQIPVAAC